MMPRSANAGCAGSMVKGPQYDGAPPLQEISTYFLIKFKSRIFGERYETCSVGQQIVNKKSGEEEE
jgi:hypothetical protein